MYMYIYIYIYIYDHYFSLSLIFEFQATICSCLKYFGQATIGVARDYDRDIMNQQLKDIVIKSSGRPMLDYIHVRSRCLHYLQFVRFI